MGGDVQAIRGDGIVNDERDPLVSILTPVYNGEAYLEECIESVMRQTYRNWIYTIVNNCSTDGTLAIAQRYAAENPRIRVHNNVRMLSIIENHGMTLRMVSPESKYCKIVFADDWLYPECLAKMVELAESHPTVGVVGAYGLSGTKVSWDGLPPTARVVPGKEMCRWRLSGGAYVFGSLTSVMFRAELARKIRSFDDPENLQADTDACFELLQDSDFGFVHQVLTFTRVENESTNSSAVRFRTTLPANLGNLLTFGPMCMSREELDRRVREHMKNYYRYLADNVLRFRGSEFWRFHKERLQKAGLPLNRLRLSWLVALRAADAVLNPKRTMENLVRTVAGWTHSIPDGLKPADYRESDSGSASA